MVLDESNNQAVLKEYYLKTRDYLASALPGDDSDRQRLNETEAELDMLVRSKQVSPVLGEIFALLVFAGITIFLTMFTRPPEPDGWIRLLLDMFAMLVSSVIIFLMIYSVDLDREPGSGARRPQAGDGGRDGEGHLFAAVSRHRAALVRPVAFRGRWGRSLSWSMPACWPTSGWDGSADPLAPFSPE